MDGATVGYKVGDAVGLRVGARVGANVGDVVVGNADGDTLGANVCNGIAV